MTNFRNILLFYYVFLLKIFSFFSFFRSVATSNNNSSNKKVKISASDKNPVMLLNELRPGLKYEVEECGESPATKRFVMTVAVDGQTFEGSGASKKLAKQACARMSLTALYNLSFTPGLIGNSDVGENGDGQESDKNNFVPGKLKSNTSNKKNSVASAFWGKFTYR